MNAIAILFCVFLFVLCIIFYALYSRARIKIATQAKELSDAAKSGVVNQSELSQIKQELVAHNTFNQLAGSIISQLDQGVICIDQNGVVRLANVYAQQFLDVAEPVGKPFEQVLHNLLVNGKNDLSLFAQAGGGMRQQLPDGVEFLARRGKVPISGTVVRIAANEASGTRVFLFADNSKNVEKIAEEKSFFSAAAHELRTPLTVIRMTASLLRTKFETMEKDKIAEHLQRVDETAEQLVHLINDFLNISRLDQGRLEMEKSHFDIVALTDEVITELHMLTKEKHLYMNHDPVCEYRSVTGDKTRAKEVLTNLISNAIKYTIQGGITITHKDMDGKMATKIADTGSGIPQSVQGLLFRRFGQVGSARSQSSAKSSGLGLYISKKFAQLMHGDVYLETSEPGKGSTFVFALPPK